MLGVLKKQPGGHGDWSRETGEQSAKDEMCQSCVDSFTIRAMLSTRYSGYSL